MTFRFNRESLGRAFSVKLVGFFILLYMNIDLLPPSRSAGLSPRAHLPQQRRKNVGMMWVNEGAINCKNAIRPGSIVRGKCCLQAGQLHLYSASASDGRSVVTSGP